jgi:outer membrane protein insertion porin family
MIRSAHVRLLACALLLVLAPLDVRADELDGSWVELLDEDPIILRVDLDGLQRTDPSGVRDKIYSEVGRPVDRARLSEDIKRLYQLGLFEDIRVYGKREGRGIVLRFALLERPLVLAVDYEIDGTAVGLDDIKKLVDIKPLQVLDEARVRVNVGKIQELYVEEGHFLADVSYRLVRQSAGVNVVFTVKEGETVKVRRVEITGNVEVPSDELKGILATREGGWFSFLTKSGEFKKELFEQDLQRLQYYYLTKGYVEIRPGEP